MKFKRIVRGGMIVLAVLSLAAALGCQTGRKELSVTNPGLSAPEPVSGLMAGAAAVDITPPPGQAMAGYSAMGKMGEGFRTRLYARALYVKDREGRAVALVTVDLLGGSRLVHHLAAEAIAEKTDVSPAGLLLAGTHTHSGPGNFFGSVFYNKMASCKAGLCEEYTRFLADRVAEAVIEACSNRRPARIAEGTAEIFGVTRNRSLAAYLKDPEADPEDPPTAQEAVNPTLAMIRVDLRDDDGVYRPAAAFSTFSVHPTAVSYGNTLYNADVFAYVEREVEEGIRKEYDPPWRPVHVAANRAHGDTTPDIPPEIDEGFAEARRIGVIIGKDAFALFQRLGDHLSSDAEVRYAAREVDLLENPCINEVCVCDRPAIGMSTLGGATTRPVPIVQKLPFFKPGNPNYEPEKTCQGAKWVVGGYLQYAVNPVKTLPHNLFIQAIQVGEMVITAAPFELTTNTGRRMDAGALEGARDGGLSGAKIFTTVAVANGYFGYAATPEEYSLQYYEGGHTLYGPDTCPYLAAQARDLTQKMGTHGAFAELPASWDFPVFPARAKPAPVVKQDHWAGGGDPSFVPAKGIEEPHYDFDLTGPAPSALDWNRTLVRLEVSKDNGPYKPLVLEGRPMDDQGYDLSFQVVNPRKGRYRASWWNPVTENGNRYRFAVLVDGENAPLYSPPFR